MFDDRLLFIGYMSFYNNMDFIKCVYNNMPSNDKWLYKYYIYAQRYLDEKTCDLIWRFLNAEKDSMGELRLRNDLYNRQSKFKFRG